MTARYWVIAADERRAHIFAAGDSLEGLEEVATLSDTELGEGGSFARRLGEALALGYASARFEWLMLVGPPDFLDALRERLEPPLPWRVLARLNLTPLPTSPAWLSELLRPHLSGIPSRR